MRFRLSTIAAVALVALCGCVPAVSEEPEAPPPPPLQAMPDLVGGTVAEAYSALSALETTRLVVYPGFRVEATTEATEAGGVTFDAEYPAFDVPERVMQLGRGEQDNHLVVAQSPDAGTPVSQIATVTLTAGEHPNDTPIEWVRGHVIKIKYHGADECFECHEETSCSDCHTSFLD